MKPQLLQQLATIGKVFKFRQTLPGNVESRIACDDIANEALTRLPVGKKPGDAIRIGREHQIASDSSLVNFRNPPVKLVEIRRIRPIRAEIDQSAIFRVAKN